MKRTKTLTDLLKTTTNEHFNDLHWSGSFEEYLNLVEEQPKIVRNSYQRMYDMITSYGTEEFKYCKQTVTKYKFFSQCTDSIGIYGLEEPLMELVDVLRSAAYHYGPERRIILLHGPVGSSKSTIVTILKKGLERYSHTDPLYSFSWLVKDEKGNDIEVPCPMNEEPLKLLPDDARSQVLQQINKKLGKSSYRIKLDGNLSPVSEYYQQKLLEEYNGDYEKMLSHVRVRRVLLSEKNRVGIGTFQPKDEKSQDATELTGDINYRKLALYGSESDPRAFDFDGEFLVSNRGMIEFQEILKLQTEFLYDLLGATQEHRVNIYL